MNFIFQIQTEPLQILCPIQVFKSKFEPSGSHLSWTKLLHIAERNWLPSAAYTYICVHMYIYIYMYVSTTLLLSIAMTDPHFLRMESVFSLLNAVWSCSSGDTLVTSNSISNFIALKIMSAIVCLITPQVSIFFSCP